MSVRSLKLCFNGEIRRFSLESLHVVEGMVSLEELKAVVRKTFEELEDKEFTLSYKDEEDDVITVSTDVELKEAFNVVKDVLCSNVLRLEITQAPESVTKKGSMKDSKAVHFRIICDGCGSNPIIGDRFKCSVRDDFDLCAQCEALDKSPHPYLKIKTPAQSPAAIMTILRPHQGYPTNPQTVGEQLASKIAETEAMYGSDAVSMGKTERPEKAAELKPVQGISMPSLVRLECLSALREFGPFYATRKPNNCLVLIDANSAKTNDAKPWKSGNCLRLVKGGGKVEMDGNGGPWASFHLEPVTDASSGGGAATNVVRIVSGNRKLCLAAASGQLVSLPSSERGIHTHFRFHQASNADEVDPIWDSMSWEKTESKGASASGCWEPPQKSDEDQKDTPFWEGMSNSLIEDVKAQMQANEATEAVLPHAPPAPTPLPQASFVKDVSVDDGEVLNAGSHFVKTWRLRNDSDFPFPSGVSLIHVGGADMGEEAHVSLGASTIHPFQEFDVSVKMTAPSKPGKYASFWRLAVNNERFGHQVWVEVNVVESPEVLMKQAQEESERIALAKLKTKEDEEQEKVLQQVALAQAEEVLAMQAALEAERLEKLRLEEVARAEDEAALAQAEAAHVEADRMAREQEQAEAAEAEAQRIEAERVHEMELIALVDAEEKRIAEEAEEERAAEEVAKADEAIETASGNSIDWEHVDVIGNDDEAAPNKIEDATEEDSDSFDPYASDLSASIEGAAMAGAALNNSGLSESVVAVLDAHSFEESMGKWGPAVTRLFEMGFDDVNAIVAACEKHSTPENYEEKLQAIVNDMLTNMPSAN